MAFRHSLATVGKSRPQPGSYTRIVPRKAHRAWRRASIFVVVFGLTPRLLSAAPPDPEAPIEQPRAPAEPEPELAPPEPTPSHAPEAENPETELAETQLEVISSARAILVIATPIDPQGQPSGDEIELGGPPLTTTLPAGRWRFETRGRGYQPWSRELELEAGVAQRLQVEPTLIEDALIELRAGNPASEGAIVELDGALLCTLPCSETLAPGNYELTIRKRRHKPLRSQLAAAQADEIEFDVELMPATSRAPALMTGTVGLATLTTALVFTIRSAKAARSLASDLDNHVQYDQHDRRLYHGRRDAIIASAMYGATAAVAGLTLYYLLRQVGPASQAQKRRRSLAVSPSFDRHGGSFQLTVGF